jgi:hypothetical protein
VLSAETKQAYGLDDLLAGADAFGRGGAYLAAENNSSYIFQNYALLGRPEPPRLTLTAFKLLSEVNYLAAAYSQGNFAAGVLNIQEHGGYVRDKKNNVTGGQIGYDDTTVYGAYGLRLEDYNLYTGARLKYHSKVFSEIEAAAWGVALDLSALYTVNSYLTIGARLNNALATPLSWTDGLQEKLPPGLGLGGRFRVFGPQGLWPQEQITEVYLDANLENTVFLGGGLEYWPSERIALRAGFKQLPAATDEREDKITKFTAGVGFNWQNIYIDYAYNPGDDLAENITHFFTLAYRFSAPPPPPPEPIPEPQPLPLRKRIFFDTVHLGAEEQILIEDLGYLGFVQGYPPGRTYLPDRALTRRELMILLIRLLESEERYPGGAPRYFPDTTYRNKDLTDKATRYGLLVGYTDGLSRLDQPARRDEAACAFARYYEIAGRALLSGDVYADVPPEHWGYKDINLTRQYYLTQGVDLVHYLPGDYISRLDTARIIGRIRYVQESRAGLPPIEGLTELLAEELSFEAAVEAAETERQRGEQQRQDYLPLSRRPGERETGRD